MRLEATYLGFSLAKTTVGKSFEDVSPEREEIVSSSMALTIAFTSLSSLEDASVLKMLTGYPSSASC